MRKEAISFVALVWLACEKESSTPVAPSPPPGDFAVRCTPAGFAAGRGCGNSTCTITSQNGFMGPVTLACSGQPSGLNCGFGPGNPLTTPANGLAATGFTVSAEPTVSSQIYTFEVVGTAAGGLRHPTPVQVQIVRPEGPPLSGLSTSARGGGAFAGARFAARRSASAMGPSSSTRPIDVSPRVSPST